MHSDNLQKWILWRDKLFCDFLLFFTTYIALNANSLTFPNIHFFPDLQQNSLILPWLLPSLEFPWLFPDRWTPCILSILACWLLKSPGHQQAWYWSPKPEYSIASIQRVNTWANDNQGLWGHYNTATLCSVHEKTLAHQTLLMSLRNVWWFVQNHQTYCLIIWKTFC